MWICLCIGMDYSNIFLMYVLLLLFWQRICNKCKASMGWMGKKMKIILAASGIIIGIILTLLPFAALITDNDWSRIIMNAFVGVVVLGLSIGYIVEGSKLYKLIRTFDHKDKGLLRNITFITTLASSGFLLTFIILLFVSVVRSMVPELAQIYVACATFQFIYRVLEFALVCVMAYPLKGYIQEPSSQSSGRISLRDVTAEETRAPSQGSITLSHGSITLSEEEE